MTETKIEWCDYSSNPLKFRDAAGNVVWGCVKVSPGCSQCYAETIAKRWNRGGPYTQRVMDGLTPFLDEKELRTLLTSKKLAGKKVFVGDMTDCFGEWVPDDLLDRMFAVFALRPDVTFQVLTKRAGRLRDYFAFEGHGRWGFIEHQAKKLAVIPTGKTLANFFGSNLPNVWLGVSVENRAQGCLRLPLLRETPAAVRFVSFEPLLDDVGNIHWPGIHWAIVGGESGPGARPCDVEWIRSIVLQCQAAGVSCFVKQLGSRPKGLEHYVSWRDSGPTSKLRDRKGGDLEEWPADLRVREFPAVQG